MTIQQFDQNGNTLSGAVSFDRGWALEQMLDLDMASAACPCCPLIYVGANSAGYPDLLTAISTAVSKGAKVGSGWGALSARAPRSGMGTKSASPRAHARMFPYPVIIYSFSIPKHHP